MRPSYDPQARRRATERLLPRPDRAAAPVRTRGHPPLRARLRLRVRRALCRRRPGADGDALAAQRAERPRRVGRGPQPVPPAPYGGVRRQERRLRRAGTGAWVDTHPPTHTNPLRTRVLSPSLLACRWLAQPSARGTYPRQSGAGPMDSRGQGEVPGLRGGRLASAAPEAEGGEGPLGPRGAFRLRRLTPTTTAPTRTRAPARTSASS